MFKIGKLFHLTHVVSDLAAADTWYDEVFSAWRFYRAYMKAAVREASLLTIGDCVMEPVQLARVPGAEQSPIGKFYARFGQRFHSIAWYVDSVEETCAALSKRNIRLYDLVGNVVKEPQGKLAVWTHPKDTHALETERLFRRRRRYRDRSSPAAVGDEPRRPRPGTSRRGHLCRYLQDQGSQEGGGLPADQKAAPRAAGHGVTGPQPGRCVRHGHRLHPTPDPERPQIALAPLGATGEVGSGSA